LEIEQKGFQETRVRADILFIDISKYGRQQNQALDLGKPMHLSPETIGSS
jgi:hypothetical protein